MKVLMNVGLVACSIQLSSCALFPRDVQPERTIKPLETLESNLGKQNVQIDDQWWIAYGDPQLNQLVALGLQRSPSLDMAGARILAAQAMLEAEKAALIPQIGVSGDIERQKLSRNYIFLPGMPTYTGYGQVDASLSWSLDIWGKQKKYYEAAKNQQKVALASYKASELLIASTIVRIYFDYDRLIQAELLFARDAEIKKMLYQIAQDRHKAGLLDMVIVNQRKIDAEVAQVNFNQAHLAKKMAQHQLAALVQEGPSWGEKLKAPATQLAALNLPEMIPANLLERRPDLQALLSQIDVARLQLEGAKLEYLPDINLTGFVGVQSFNLPQLFSGKSQQFGIGPTVGLPIFDGGLINANIVSKEANRDQAIAAYQEQLAQALKEVADSLGSIRSAQANYANYDLSYQTAKNNYDIIRHRSDVGINSKESVLSVEQAYIAQEQNFADAKQKLLTANVVLIQALGGSYLKSPAQPH